MNFSRKLSNPHPQSNLSSEIGQFIALNQQEFAELLTFVDFAEKFTIGFVEVNFPPDAELLIEALNRNSECRDIQFVTLVFACAMNVVSLQPSLAMNVGYLVIALWRPN